MSARFLIGAGVAAAVVIGSVSSALGGTPPKRADKELGTVLSNPRIFNLLWDDNWTAHNSSPLKKGNIHTFVRTLTTTSAWTSGATQYGVKSWTFGGTVDASSKCGDTRAPTTVTTPQILLWAGCMVGKGGVTGPVVRVPVSNDVYIVYLPERTTITDRAVIPALTLLGKTYGPWTLFDSSSCTPGGYAAYHAFTLFVAQLFSVIVEPTKCVGGSLDDMTQAVSHEVIEAAANPLLALGWIDTSLTFGARYTQGELADICEPGTGAVGTAGVSHGRFTFATYWSNSAGACVG